MYTLIVLLLLCIIEIGLFYWKWSEIKEYIEFGKDISAVTGIQKQKKYSVFVKILGKFLKIGKYIIFVLSPIVFVINLIIASIFGTILSLIF